jgi:hypothetical protein
MTKVPSLTESMHAQVIEILVSPAPILPIVFSCNNIPQNSLMSELFAKEKPQIPFASQ